MSTYYLNEAAFDLGSVDYTDRSINLLDIPTPGGKIVTILVQRSPLAVGQSLREAVTAHLRREALNQRAHTVLSECECEVNGVPAIEVVTRWRGEEGMVVTREAHIAAGAQRLYISATTTFDEKAACDEHMERVLSTLRLRT